MEIHFIYKTLYETIVTFCLDIFEALSVAIAKKRFMTLISINFGRSNLVGSLISYSDESRAIVLPFLNGLRR